MADAQNPAIMAMFSNLYKMQQCGKYCDVEIITRSGEKFFAHSCILAASSTKFADILNNIRSSQKIKRINLSKEIESSVFELLLHAIYHCKFIKNNAEEQIEDPNDDELFLASLLEDIEFEDFTTTAVGHFGVQVTDEYKKLSEKYPKKPKPEGQQSEKIKAMKEKRKIEIEKRENDESELPPEITEDDVPVDNDDPTDEPFTHRSIASTSRAKKTTKKTKPKKKKRVSHTCTTCNKTFTLKSSHQKHIKTCGVPVVKKPRRPMGPKKCSCKVCGKSFTSRYVMQLHMRTHTGDELFSCNICGKKFPYRSSLATHNLTHSDVKPYICSICGKSFRQKIHAKEHESQHAGEKRFNCTECNKFFAHKSGLVRHIADIHFHHRPYICETCGRAFSRRSKLMEHSRTHTGEKPYICDICGSAYKANRSLKLHKRSQHDIIVPDYEVGISAQWRKKAAVRLPSETEAENNLQAMQAMAAATSQPLSSLSTLPTMVTTQSILQRASQMVVEKTMPSIPEKTTAPLLQKTAPPVSPKTVPASELQRTTSSILHRTAPQMVFSPTRIPPHGSPDNLAAEISNMGRSSAALQMPAMPNHSTIMHSRNTNYMKPHEILYQQDMTRYSRLTTGMPQMHQLPSMNAYDLAMMSPNQLNFGMPEQPPVPDVHGMNCEE